MTTKEKAQHAEIARGARLIFDNAEALYNEAQVLRFNKSFARAVTLHQISMEECSKVDMLGAAVAGLHYGMSIDLDKLARQMSRHETKNHNNADFTVVTAAEKSARERGDFKEAKRIFEEQRGAFHKYVNDLKNDALYVDFKGGKFSSPLEVVSEKEANEMLAVNAYFLRHASMHLYLIEELLGESEEFRDRMLALKEGLAGLAGVKPADYQAAYREMMGALVERFAPAKVAGE